MLIWLSILLSLKLESPLTGTLKEIKLLIGKKCGDIFPREPAFRIERLTDGQIKALEKCLKDREVSPKSQSHKSPS